MFQGFYGLTSSVLTHTRTLDMISNNMANAATPGYKSDDMTVRSFEQEVLYRSNNKDSIDGVEVGAITRGVEVDEAYVDYTQGVLQVSNRPLDFAITTPGFFRLDSNGETVYSRNGSFSLDAEGYLTLQGVGRVLGEGGAIFLGTDKVVADKGGNLFDQDSGALLGTIDVVTFGDYATDVVKSGEGVYTALGAPIPIDATIEQKMLERSNTDVVEAMADMMATQRSLQSSAQLMTMYDQLMAKIVTQLGPQ